MGIEDVTIGRDFDDDVIAGVRHIVRHAVGHTDHLAGGYTVDWLVVAEITVVLVFRAFPGRAHAVYRLILHPVNRIALRQPGMPAVDKHGSTMGCVRPVIDGIPSDPVATERRRDDDRAFVRNDHRRKDGSVSSALVVNDLERMVDRAWSFAADEIEKQKNDQAAAAIER